MTQAVWPWIRTPPLRQAVDISIFAGIKVKGFEAIVDTAAEDAVIGETALQLLEKELAKHGLQTARADLPAHQVPCAGIGGQASLKELVDVPIAVAGVQGILRFNVLKDMSMATPPLLPISFLEVIGATIDLVKDELVTNEGGRAPMTRLPSGHRTVDIMQFHDWTLPEHFRQQEGNPFQLSQSTKNFGEKPSASSTWTCASSVSSKGQPAATTKSASSASSLIPTGSPTAGLASSTIPTGSPTAGLASSTIPTGSPTAGLASSTIPTGPATARSASVTDLTGHQEDKALEQRDMNSTNTTVIETAEAMAGIYVTLKNGLEVESMAKNLREQSRWSMEDMEEFLNSVHARHRGRDRNIMKLSGGSTENSFAMIMGRYVYGGFDGITNNTSRYPETAKYLNEWMKRQYPGLKFTSMCLNYDLRASMHRDVNNAKLFPSATVSFGKYTGGKLWIQNGGATETPEEEATVWRKSPLGGRMAGQVFDTFHRARQFYPNCWHRVEKYHGVRISLTAYVIRGIDEASEDHAQKLSMFGFPLPSREAPQAECQHVLLTDEPNMPSSSLTQSQCEFDMELAFDLALKEKTSPPSTFRLERMMQRVAQFFLNSNRRPSRAARQHVFSSPTSRAHGSCGPEGELDPAPQQKDGHGEDRSRMEEAGRAGNPHDPDGQTTDAGRSDDAEQRGPGREARAPHHVKAAKPEVNSSAHQSQRAGDLQPSGRQAEVPSECQEAVVDVRAVRFEVDSKRPSREDGPTDS